MIWKAELYLILAKFIVGYGAGFTTILGWATQLDATQMTVFNMLIFPAISGIIMVFPQLVKTFSEAGNELNRKKKK